MSLVISKVFTYDTDAGNYIQAVEAADGQALEAATRQAINNFVVGCKQDGIWSAIKASCILAGARTLSGALVPLANASGITPTLNGTAGGWNYNRKTGLQGNGTDNYIDSGRNNNAELSQNSKHVSVYVNTFGNLGYLGSGSGLSSGVTQLYGSGGSYLCRNNETNTFANIGVGVSGLFGTSRSSGTSYIARKGGVNTTINSNSDTPNNANIYVFNIPTLNYFTNARLAFYSIGESLDLAKLDSRVTDLITAFGAAIP